MNILEKVTRLPHIFSGQIKKSPSSQQHLLYELLLCSYYVKIAYVHGLYQNTLRVCHIQTNSLIAENVFLQTNDWLIESGCQDVLNIDDCAHQGTLWHTMAHQDTPWHTKEHQGTPRQSVPQSCGTPRHTKAECASKLWHTMAECATKLWHTMPHQGTLWYIFVAHHRTSVPQLCGTLAHCGTLVCPIPLLPLGMYGYG